MLNIFKKIKSYMRSRTASIGVAFAVLAPVLLGATGMSLDFARAYLVQQRLHQALDAAALAAAASSTDPATIEQKVQDFFDANYPPEKLGITFDPEVVVDGNEITVSGSARYNTLFVKFIGIDELDVGAQTVVQREVQGLEVVMVLDNTGSMATNDNIDALQDATKSFINILFDRTSNPNYIKIGMVPYANSVRVGLYGLGQYPDGSTYADGDVFITLPDDVDYTTDHTSDDWYGCVVEHKESGYEEDATHVAGSKGQLWRDGSAWDGHGWNALVDGNDPYDYDVLDNYEGPWDIYMYGKLISQGNTCGNYSGYRDYKCSNCDSDDDYECQDTVCFCWKRDSSYGTNRSCPKAYIMPMNSDRDDLLDHVDTMEPHGNTLGNIGMTWGARLLSPEAPFEEASDWDDINWRKAIVMMTDGNNTDDSTYSAYWFASRNDMWVSKYNERFEETCEALKEQGVTIYTVTFTSNISDDTKGYYERCASSEDQHFDAPTQEELIEVFEQISRELSNLHIKG